MPIVSLGSLLSPKNPLPFRVRLDEFGAILLRLDWTELRLIISDSIGLVHRVSDDIFASRGPFDAIQSGLSTLLDLYSKQRPALDAGSERVVAGDSLGASYRSESAFFQMLRRSRSRNDIDQKRSREDCSSLFWCRESIG